MMEQQQDQRQMKLKTAVKMAEALERIAQRIITQPPPFRPEKLPGAGRQIHELVAWVKRELDIQLPSLELPDDPDPFSFSLAVTQLLGALRLLAGEEVVEETQKRKKEPLIRIRDQKSPVEFAEVVITSAEDLAEFLRTGLPDWIKRILSPKITVKTTSKEEPKVKAYCMEVGEEAQEEEKERATVRLTEKLSEQLKSFEETIEDAAEDLEEIEEELEEMEDEGYLTDELKTKLETKREKIIHRVRDTLNRLQQILGE